jgi:hypothetical protein
MIEMTCWGCGWEGRAPERFAGLRVTCSRCGSANVVPDRVSDEIYAAEWVRAIDPAAERELEILAAWPDAEPTASPPHLGSAPALLRGPPPGSA